MHKRISLSVVLPAYNDALTIPSIIQNLSAILPKVSNDYEIIVVNDGSVDATANVLKNLQRRYRFVTVITHKKNKGYGATLIDGFHNAKKDYIFYTDSDGQYDPAELPKLVKALDKSTDLISGYKIQRHDSWIRKIVGLFYNQTVRILFQLPVRDVDCDFRIFKRSLLKNIQVETTSGAFDVAFIHALKKQNVRVKNIPVHHYARKYGQSQFFTLRRIIDSIRDVSTLWIKNLGK